MSDQQKELQLHSTRKQNYSNALKLLAPLKPAIENSMITANKDDAAREVNEGYIKRVMGKT